MIITQLASHGFVVIASLEYDCLPARPRDRALATAVGLNWILQQSEDPTSPYYHHLDTAHMSPATGHSEGGFATSVVGSDPRIIAIATMAGATATPKATRAGALLCGGQDTVVPCTTIQKSFDAITSTPVMLEEKSHRLYGSSIRLDQGTPIRSRSPRGWRRPPDGDTVLRTMFYGANCQLCRNTQVMVQRKNMD